MQGIPGSSCSSHCPTTGHLSLGILDITDSETSIVLVMLPYPHSGQMRKCVYYFMLIIYIIYIHLVCDVCMCSTKIRNTHLYLCVFLDLFMHINIMNSFFNEFLIISNPNPKSQSSNSDAMHHGDLLLLYPDRNHKQVKRNNSSTGIYRPLSVESLESVLTDPVAYSFCSLFMLPSEPA